MEGGGFNYLMGQLQLQCLFEICFARLRLPRGASEQRAPSVPFQIVL